MKDINLGVTYKKLGKLPTSYNGQPIQPGTRAHTTDGVWWELVADGEWKRLGGPEIPIMPVRVTLD